MNAQARRVISRARVSAVSTSPILRGTLDQSPPARHTRPHVIEIAGLSKRYGKTLAVDNLSFSVEAGKITGFLGPNGAGKTTTLRALLGLVRPTAGSATIDGKHYAELELPFKTVGAVLEA